MHAKTLLKFLALFVLASLLAIPAGAQDQALPRLKLIPALNGYPAGSQGPLLLLLELPPGTRLARGGDQVLRLGLEKSSPFRLRAQRYAALEERPGSLLVMARLAVAPDTPVGETRVRGILEVVLEGKGKTQAGFELPLNVLAAGSKPRMLAPAMMRRLGVMQGDIQAKAAAHTAEPAPAGEKDPFANRSLWLILGLVFLAGLGLNFTPCVYPLIPITVSVFGGRAHDGRAGLVSSALAYWLGLALTYSVLGVLVALSGRMLGQALTSPWVTLGIVAVLLAMAASMFGLWEIRMPASLNRLAGSNRAGVAGALLMGLFVGVLAAPCVGPFVVGLLTHVAQVGRVDYGLLLFLALSAGLGLPLCLLAMFSGSISRLPGAGDWMVWVRAFFGVILVLMAVYTARPLMGDTAFAWTLAILGVLGGLYLGFVQKGGRGRFVLLKRVVGVVMIALALVGYGWLAPSPGTGPGKTHWQPYTARALKQAAAAGKPVMVLFTADWCPPCRQLKAETLPDPRVSRVLDDFVVLKADVTTGGSPEVKKLARKWRVRGVPTMFFLDSRGKLLPELTTVGFIPPQLMLRRLEAARGRPG